MRVLIACEFSGTVRDAFAALGHDAWSCDLLPCPRGGQHIIGDAREIVAGGGWDFVGAHPPCTYLTCAAEWAYKDPDFKRYPGVGYHQRLKPGTLFGAERRSARKEAVEFFRFFLEVDAPWGYVENPRGHINSAIRGPDQTVQPYEFGENASKATGLWLRGLPEIFDTQYVEPRLVNGKPRWANQTDSGQNRLSPSDDRWALRSLTYTGIARAMAEQWSHFISIQCAPNFPNNSLAPGVLQDSTPPLALTEAA